MLPAWEIFKGSFELIWFNRQFLLGASWPYFLYSLIFHIIEGAVWNFEAPDGFQLVGFIGALILLNVAAIYWCRNILLNENAVPAIPLPFNNIVKSYLWRTCQLSIITMVPFLLVVGASGVLFAAVASPWMGEGIGDTSSTMTIIALASIPGMFALMYFNLRFGLALPAAAINDLPFAFQASWQSTTAHRSQILTLTIYTSIVMCALTGVDIGVGWLEEAYPNEYAIKLLGFVSLTLVYVIQTFAIAAQLSLIYHFVAREEQTGVF